ncbi:MAG: translation initiation factor IF-3 [Candidatus Omnitrophica bacterium]|nr:translation initiation factor IF-3 [Candidatus Omnitrophota bacterium]
MRVNERIRINQVRVIGEAGEQLGVMLAVDALRLARERGLDLVEVAPQTSPPVCRILDFNKFRYEEQRREREAKKKHHVAKLKEVKFKPHIETHDYQVKLDRLKRFLMRGDQAKVTMVYRGRELAHTELGRRILDRLIEDLKPISKVERNPALDGRFMTMVFGPDREKIRQLERQTARQRALAERAAASHASPVGSMSPAGGSPAAPGPHGPTTKE